MEIFIAEDEADVKITYKIALEDKKHRVNSQSSGQHCLEVYNDKLQNIRYLTKTLALCLRRIEITVLACR